jgi:hypothetical protein
MSKKVLIVLQTREISDEKKKIVKKGGPIPLYLCFKQNYLPLFFSLSFSIAYNVVKIKYLVKVVQTKLIINK